MDLVVNGPLKAAIRRQAPHLRLLPWKYERVKAIAEGNELPSFAPPVPRLAEGLNALFVALRGRLASPEFISSLARVFVKVGLQRAPGVPDYVKYTSHTKLGNLMDLVLAKDGKGVRVENKDDVTTLGEIATQFGVRSRGAIVEDEEDGEHVPIDLEDDDESSSSSEEEDA